MARDPDRIDPLLEKIGELWKQVPDFRLPQLLFCIMDRGTPKRRNLFYTEDDELERRIDQWLEELNERSV